MAWNRLEFTRESFTTLVASTDWSLVRELVVYDDGSEDGADAWLEQAIATVPAPVRFARTRFGSPVTAMLDFIARARAPILAKVDNDAMLPPGWLRQSLAVLDRYPELDLLGIEAMNPHSDDPELARSYAPAAFISGLGLYRRAAFADSQPRMYQRYFGLEEWQVARGAQLRRGWIDPALPVFLLDRTPLEPWASLSARYVQRGWQRVWPAYPPDCTLWHWRWPPGAAATPGARALARAVPAIASDSEQRLQFCYCDEPPRPGFTHARVLPFPGPGDLDLRAAWPWADNSFSYISAHELVEHLPDPLHTMNELWRVLAPGGDVEIAVPTTDGSGAFQDPTHVSFWNRGSFRFFEAGAPEREGLARRAPLRAAFTVLRERLDQTSDGPRLTILLRALKDAPAARHEHPAAEAPAATTAAEMTPLIAPPGDGRFLCALRVKNEAAHMGEVLERALGLCGRALVLDDHSTDATPRICRQFGPRVQVISSPFTGLDEARDKNYLLQRIIAAGPEWVLWIDGDEVLERSGPERIKQAVRESPGAAVFALRIAYLWDRADQERIDGIWGRFYRPSLFRLTGQRHEALSFGPTGQGGNFHCGNVPRGLRGPLRRLQVRLKHYGYLERERRQAKYHWYNQIDPNNEAEDCYRHLAELPGARFAPGPAQLRPWRE
ncbi:MAG: glycosyltransferase [Chloroflexaceae bacterium]|nr:glycosyltransferase [Chloroflexaceae bacterium]